MHTFKVGDKFKVIKDLTKEGVTKGNVYTIYSIDAQGDNWFIDDNGDIQVIISDRLDFGQIELIPRKSNIEILKQMMQNMGVTEEGDRYELLPDKGGQSLTIEEIPEGILFRHGQAKFSVYKEDLAAVLCVLACIREQMKENKNES